MNQNNQDIAKLAFSLSDEDFYYLDCVRLNRTNVYALLMRRAKGEFDINRPKLQNEPFIKIYSFDNDITTTLNPSMAVRYSTALCEMSDMQRELYPAVFQHRDVIQAQAKFRRLMDNMAQKEL